ncbi:uncharacterized protein LOC117176960 [Belonocnema kinseyi]|uniref:uncharacterized protein LOC117176960 n=1 Tax=Belonocnema kinseyi TaxID=2817044 RepID=UPI00143CC89C|nr:uncharacterized protein LOC117176960 [Belonocnema kinseyi]
MKIVYAMFSTLVIILHSIEMSSQSGLRDLMLSSKVGDSSGRYIEDSAFNPLQTLRHLTIKDYFEFPLGCNLHYAIETTNHTSNGSIIAESLELIPFNVRYKVQKNKSGWIFGFIKDTYLERMYLDGKLATISANPPHPTRILSESENLFLSEHPLGYQTL